MSLLVVDDEAVTRRVVIYTLKAIGITVIDAADAASALRLAEQQEHQIDLMLVDINLPDMDGFTLMRQLHAIERVAHAPIIAFTARNNADDEIQAREVGAVGFLYKPFSTQELRDLVTRYIHRG